MTLRKTNGTAGHREKYAEDQNGVEISPQEDVVNIEAKPVKREGKEWIQTVGRGCQAGEKIAFEISGNFHGDWGNFFVFVTY